MSNWHNKSQNYSIDTMDTSNTVIKDIDQVIEKAIFMEFMHHCYPSNEMGLTQFCQFMKKQNIPDKDISLYFRCFDTTKNGLISFDKFLMGVNCMDFNTVHGGQTGELRCRYIFSFYDEDGDGFLTSGDLRNMVIDINTRKGKSTDEDTITIDHQKALRVFGMDSINTKFELDTFLIVVGNLLFRGTSSLFRFDPEVSFSNRCHPDINSNQSIADHILNNIDRWEYSLAVHSVKVQNEGGNMTVCPIWDDICNQEQLGEFGDRFNLTYTRLHSVNTFSRDSCPNEILQSLKYFRYPDRVNSKREMDWGNVNMDILSKYLNLLCDDVMNIVFKEPKMIEIQSPAYVLGDLHGNFASLSQFEDVLWRLGMGLSPGKFLFLGDYVDRGKYGIEVVAYLFAQKILNPNQVYLLRGNHEIRSIQEQYTFKRECIDKFGEACGTCVWNSINNVFDILPLAAIIDNRLFCVHGGIPRPSLISLEHSESDPLMSLRESINKIQNPLPDPERESPMAWEIMWSDPDRQSKCDLDNNFAISSHNSGEDFGFCKNENRKTAYCFNRVALETFLSKYHLSHVIRAHEVQQIGFNVEHQAKLLTVFSSSDYCHNNNEAACVLVSNQKLRLIRMDTGE